MSVKKRLIKAEKAASLSRNKDTIGAGRKELAKMREEGAIPITSQDPARHLAEGGEHRVELSADPTRVIKHTKGGLFGFVPAADAQGHIVLKAASPLEYLDRQAAQEKLFPTDLKLEGSHPEEFGGLTYSQTFYKGTHPEVSEVRAFLEPVMHFGRGYGA